MLFLKVFSESIRQAMAQLIGNKLRTFLSLLGISIGIFCIIGVLSAVESLESSVQGSFAKLGEDVVYVDKWPWKDNSGDWWEYFQRPHPDHDDYERLKERMPTASVINYSTEAGRKVVKYNRSAVEGASVLVTTYELDRMYNVEIQRGRYWTPSEYSSGADKAIIGHEVAAELFGAIPPVGKTMKMGSQKYEVIGVFDKTGGDLINIIDYDYTVAITYTNAARFMNLKNSRRFGGRLAVKAKEGVPLQQLEDDIRGILRSGRGLRPREEDNFSLNQLTMIADSIGGFFGVLNMVGGLIGLFSMIVGAISVANIMFVSVKERTSLIGVKKALGARQFVILLEFLTESVILCIIGGVIGLGLVVGVTSIINMSFESFAINLSLKYAVIGVVLSAVVGILAGAVPAGLAAKMDPVEAMRS
ncbi:ABC transporter permease [Neolewinella persica]|uniref:ABC transporter permease n=1 Tax=Neolewinella persica TaxID=70998 RepID=UPI0003A9BF16|nr:ABC transporter permease [Neolewinella persica]